MSNLSKKIAVIDLDSIIFVVMHPKKILDENGSPRRTEDNRRFLYDEKNEDEIIESCDYMMHALLSATKSTHYIAFVKGSNTTTSRLAINSEYKANRPAESPKWWKYCVDYYVDKWGAVKANGLEVDDAVNITRLNLENSFMIAIDGDLLSQETTHNSHYNWKTAKWIDVSKSEANCKFWSDMICGQSSDNIKGLPGKGMSYFNKLVSALGTNYPSIVLDAYIEHFKSEEDGIREFYKVYNTLKTLDKKDGFIIPDPIEYIHLENRENNKFEILF